jgi:hypothetical protein
MVCSQRFDRIIRHSKHGVVPAPHPYQRRQITSGLANWDFQFRATRFGNHLVGACTLTATNKPVPGGEGDRNVRETNRYLTFLSQDIAQLDKLGYGKNIGAIFAQHGLCAHSIFSSYGEPYYRSGLVPVTFEEVHGFENLAFLPDASTSNPTSTPWSS